MVLTTLAGVLRQGCLVLLTTASLLMAASPRGWAADIVKGPKAAPAFA